MPLWPEVSAESEPGGGAQLQVPVESIAAVDGVAGGR